MGTIAKQSGFAAAALSVGLAIGAVNTMYVLPRAFEGNEAVWGLLRIMTSWGLIVSTISTLGTPSAIIRFLGRYPEEKRPAYLNSILLISFLGIALCLGAIGIWGEAWVKQLDPNNADLLTENLSGFALIILTMSIMAICRALLTLYLRTGYISWVDEVWQKSSYLLLGVMLWWDRIPIQWFVPAYLITWLISLALLFLRSWRYFPNPRAGIDSSEMASIMNYSGFTLLAGGAAIIANQLDYVMIGMYLGLEEVPMYTLGFFIGSVVAMPSRATQAILYGILAFKVDQSNEKELQQLNKNAARVNVLLMTCIMAGIWAGFSPLEQMLPPAYRGLSAIFLCIAASKLILGLNSANNQHLSLSQHYRLALPLNLGLIVVTILSNYVFIVIFKWGLTGAALATLGTAIWNNGWRLLIMWNKFKIHPFSRPIPVILVMGFAAANLFHWPSGSLGWHPIFEAFIMGSLAAGSTFAASYILGFFPELRQGLKMRLPWWP